MTAQRLGLVVLLAPYVQYLLAGCLDIFTRITNEERIVDYMNSGDGTSAHGVDWNVCCPCQPAMKRENVDTGSAAITLDSI